MSEQPKDHWQELQATREALLVTLFAMRDLVEVVEKVCGSNPAVKRGKGVLEASRKLFPDVEI